MQRERARCLFCSAELGGRGDCAPHKEHIVPRSLTGFSWLTTRDICRRCNNSFGTYIDAVADSGVLHPFRVDAGLRTNRRAKAEFVDEESGQTIVGYFDAATREFEHLRKVITFGPEHTLVVGSSPPEAIARAEAEAKRLRESGQRVEVGQVVQLPKHVSLAVPGQESDFVRLGRLAAKAAIEYVALVAGREVAMRSELQVVRSHAILGGSPEVVALGRLVATKAIWLPRARASIWLDPSDPSPQEEEALRLGKRLSGSVEIGPPSHSLLVSNTDRGFRFQLVLFSLFVLRIDTGPISELSWARQDACDLLSMICGRATV